MDVAFLSDGNIVGLKEWSSFKTFQAVLFVIVLGYVHSQNFLFPCHIFSHARVSVRRMEE
jgi:hypothetical protein